MPSHPLIEEIEAACLSQHPELDVVNRGSYVRTGGSTHWAVAEQTGRVTSEATKGDVIQGHRLSVEFVTEDLELFSRLMGERSTIEAEIGTSVQWLPGANSGNAGRSILRASRSLSEPEPVHDLVQWAMTLLGRLHDATSKRLV